MFCAPAGEVPSAAASSRNPAIGPPDELAVSRVGFDDDWLAELLFKYRAGNFFEALNIDERERWEVHRAARLLEGEGGARSIDALLAQLDVLSDFADEKAHRVLELLSDYAELISPEMG